MLNNETLDMCPNDDRYDRLFQITLVIWHIFALLAIVLGVPGNMFQIVILSHKSFRQDPPSLYMIAISVCDLIFLLGGFWFWIFSVGLIRVDPRQVFSCGNFYSIITGSSNLSNIYLALMCINRSAMVLWPIRYRTPAKQSNIIVNIFIAAILMIILLVPHHFYFHYDQKTTLFLCEFHSSVSRRGIRLWSFAHAIIFVSIPMFIVCVSSIILLTNRYRHHQMQKPNRSLPAVRMLNRSILLVFFSFGLGFSLLPACILQIFIVHDRVFSSDDLCSIRWKIYKILSNCFLILSSFNFSMKFYIHLVISTIFREHFISLITCQGNRPRSSSTTTTRNKKEEEMIPMSPRQSLQMK